MQFVHDFRISEFGSFNEKLLPRSPRLNLPLSARTPPSFRLYYARGNASHHWPNEKCFMNGLVLLEHFLVVNKLVQVYTKFMKQAPLHPSKLATIAKNKRKAEL